MERRGAGGGCLLIVLLMALPIGLPLLLLAGGDDSSTATSAGVNCPPPADDVYVPTESALPEDVAGYSGEQLENALAIMQAGYDLNLSARDQTIGVMTAMGESTLRVLDHGDTAGPDSRGLFQQRDNGAWGSYEDRMDPYTSATNFFLELQEIPARSAVEPTLLAHDVQVNLDPYHYAPYWDAATQVVAALGHLDAGRNPCPLGFSDVPLTDGDWMHPGAPPITSPYGPRTDPITGAASFHYGTDYQAGGCGGPIYAVHGGIVSNIAVDSYGGWWVEVDHGGGIVTHYKHSERSGILVNINEAVSGGQIIALTGSSGYSTGCHLHFMVLIDGTHVNPQTFLAEAITD